MVASHLSVLVADEYSKVSPNGSVPGGDMQPASRGVRLCGCGGEVVSFQVVIDARDAAAQGVKIEFEPLIGKGRARIEPDRFRASLVGFVRAPSVAYTGWKPSEWRPDPLFPFHPFTVIRGDVQPVWINLRIPRNLGGLFKGGVIVSALGRRETQVAIRLRVWNVNLPRRTALVNAFDFGLSEKLSGFERLYGPVTGKGLKPFERFMRCLADHRVNRLFYAHFLSGGLLRVQERNGHFRYDLRRVRPLLKLVARLNLGFNHFLGPIWSDPYIHCNLYPMFERFRSLGRRMYSDSTFNRCVVDLAADLYRRLERLGGESRHAHAYFYDEPYARQEDHMALLSRRLKDACPETTQVVAIGRPACIRSIIKKDLPIDAVFGHLTFYDAALRKQLEASGRAYWWYTSNWWEPSGSHISFWVDEPALHHRIIYWLTWRYRVPGFGYWNTNSWNYRTYGYDNVDAGRRMDWPYSNWNVAPNGGAGSGDGVLVYPGPGGPIGSIRFEVIRHGWQDHACLTMLESHLEKSGGARRRSLEQFIAQTRRRIGTLKNFTRNTDVLKNIRHEVGKRLEAFGG